MKNLKLPAGRPKETIRRLAGSLLDQCKVVDGSCLVWTGEELAPGVPVIRINGMKRLARRVAWECANLEAVGFRGVADTCGRGTCIRPDHLRVTTKGAARRTGMPAACDRL